MSSRSAKSSPCFEPISFPKVSLAMKFRALRQAQNESIPEFMIRLSEVASKCNFRKFQTILIRDQFIWGLKSKKIRRILSTENDIKSPITALKRAVALKTKEINPQTDVKQSGELQSPVTFHITMGRHTMYSPNNHKLKVVHKAIILSIS